MNTPESITELEPGQIFVFGSNSRGVHGGGAASFAVDYFGAIWGQGEGLQGQSYAIPTMGRYKEISDAVKRFLEFAEEHQELTFLVTKIGTGIAGRTVSEIAPLFSTSPSNVVLPVEFEEAH